MCSEYDLARLFTVGLVSVSDIADFESAGEGIWKFLRFLEASELVVNSLSSSQWKDQCKGDDSRYFLAGKTLDKIINMADLC